MLNSINFISDETVDQTDVVDFNANISNDFTKFELERISSFLMDEITKDKSTRDVWLNDTNRMIDSLGLRERKKSFSRKYGAFDTSALRSITDIWFSISNELLKKSGCAALKNDSTLIANERMLQSFNDVVSSLNKYLTLVDVQFYNDYKEFLYKVLIYGCITRKISLSERGFPITRMIDPENFFVKYDTINIYDSERYTHVIYHTKKEFLDKIAQGIYGSISQEDTKIISAEKDNRLKFYEIDCYFDLYGIANGNVRSEEDMFTLETYENIAPYIITVCDTLKRVVAITPNWLQGDASKKRLKRFCIYKLLPSLSIYGHGLASIFYNDGNDANVMKRQIVDSATAQNFPLMFYAKTSDMGTPNSDIDFQSQNQLIPISLDAGTNLNDSFIIQQHPGPSPVLMEMQQHAANNIKEFSSVSLREIPTNMAVGTALIMQEESRASKIAILSSIYDSFDDELRFIVNGLKISGYFGEEFKETNVPVIPVADFTGDSKTMKAVKAEKLLDLATKFPEFLNVRNTLIDFLVVSGFDEEKISSLIVEPKEAAPQEQQLTAEQQINARDLEVRAMEAQLKADTEKQKIELEYKKLELMKIKTELDIQLAMAKLEVNREIAKEKTEASVIDSTLKFEANLESKASDSDVRAEAIDNILGGQND